MAHPTGKWAEAEIRRDDIKDLMEKTKKLATMYSDLLAIKRKGWENIDPTGFWFCMDFDEKRNNLAHYVDVCELDCDSDTTGYDFLCFGYRKIKE